MRSESLTYVAAMIFESCASDSRSSNILTSPELSLLSSQELVVTMASVPSTDYSPVELYKTSSVGVVGTRIGLFSLQSPVTSGDFKVRYAIFRICIPAGTYQLAFIAADVSGARSSAAAIAEVSLSNSTCSVVSPEGICVL